jgi:hypothetical protein
MQDCCKICKILARYARFLQDMQDSCKMCKILQFSYQDFCEILLKSLAQNLQDFFKYHVQCIDVPDFFEQSFKLSQESWAEESK